MSQKAYEIAVYGPLFIVTWQRTATDAEYQAYLEHLLTTCRRAAHFAIVLDAVLAPNLPPSQRAMLNAWHGVHDKLLRHNCLGTAYVFASPVSRFVLSSLLLQGEPPHPYAVCTSRPEALARAAAWLRSGGIDPEPLLARANAARERLGG
jgi:hypothetical protein